MLTEDEDAGPGQRAADGDAAAVDVGVRHHVVGGGVGALGRSVLVDQSQPLRRTQRAGRAGQPRGERLARGHHQPQVRAGLRDGLDQRGQHGRHDRQQGRDPLGAQQPGQRVRVRGLVLGGQYDAPAGGQRGEQVADRGVEGERGASQDRVLGADPKGGGQRGQIAGDRGVRDGDALGPAGGPGGVQQVGQVARSGQGGQVGRLRVVRVGGARHRGDLVHLQHGYGVRHPGREPVGQSAGQHQAGPAVREDRTDPLGRVSRVEGDVGAARLEDGQYGDDRTGVTAGHDGDRGLRADAALPQPHGPAGWRPR